MHFQGSAHCNPSISWEPVREAGFFPLAPEGIPRILSLGWASSHDSGTNSPISMKLASLSGAGSWLQGWFRRVVIPTSSIHAETPLGPGPTPPSIPPQSSRNRWDMG